jgi:hypothetical protein
MQVYQHPTENRTYYAPDVEPSVETGFPVLGINGLNNFAPPRPRTLKRDLKNLHTNTTGSGPGGVFLGSDRRAAYYGGTALTGAGQVVGLFGLNFRMTDVAAYFNNSAVNQPLPWSRLRSLASIHPAGWVVMMANRSSTLQRRFPWRPAWAR